MQFVSPHSVWLGEFFGTFILLLLGGGVNASVSLRKTYAENARMDGRDHGLGPLRSVRRAYRPGLWQPGGALESSHYALGRHHHRRLLADGHPLAGANPRSHDGGPRWCGCSSTRIGAITPEPGAKLGVFCTSPAIPHLPSNLLGEVIGTFVLVLVANAIGSHGVSPNGPAAGVGPWLVASLVWGIGLSLGSTTGYAINPARDFGPRLMHWLLPIAGKGRSNWRYAWVPIVGDLTGAGPGRPAGALGTFSKHFLEKFPRRMASLSRLYRCEQ